MTPEQLHILQHAIGADKYGRREQYSTRNHFVTDATCADGIVCESLVAIGLMANLGSQGELTGGMNLYRVTSKGESAVLLESPCPPKLTRSQKRYQEWLDCAADSISFAEWLRWKFPKKAKFEVEDLG